VSYRCLYPSAPRQSVHGIGVVLGCGNVRESETPGIHCTYKVISSVKTLACNPKPAQ
jgi:hypothetical protein